MIGIRSRILIITVGSLAFAGVVSTLAINLITRTSLEHQLVARMEAELAHFADNITEPLLLEDRTGLKQAVSDAKRTHNEVEYLFVIGRGGKVLASSFAAGVPRDVLLANRIADSGKARVRMLDTERGRIFDVARSALPDFGGEIHMGVRAGPILEVVTEAVNTLLLIEAASLVLALLGAFVLADLVARPMHRLLATVEKVGAGDLSATTGIRSDDETGRLARAFDLMVARLHESRTELREVAERAEAIVACFPNALLVTDRTGQIISANPAAAMLTGLPESAIRGQNLSALFVSGAAEEPVGDLDSALRCEQTTLSYEMALRQADAPSLPVAFNAAPMVLRRRFRGYVVEVRNLTHLRSAIAALQVQYDRLEEQASGVLDAVAGQTPPLPVDETHLVRSDRLVSLGQLAASVAHEINNPIFAIITSARVLQRDLGSWPTDVEERAHILDGLKTIVAESHRCSGILRGFLRYARAGAPGWDLVEVATVLEDVRDLIAPQADTHNVEITHQLEPTGKVKADAQQLHQVFVNIELNAMQAMPDGGRLTITTRADAEHGNIDVTIEDTGTGIPPEVLPKVFMPFFTTKGRQVGTGLGLAVARGIVRRLGGEITLTSVVGEGTTARVTLPVASPTDDHERDI